MNQKMPQPPVELEPFRGFRIEAAEGYTHLAVIQNGIALHALFRLGYPEDERVVKACDNLYFLWDEYGGWCQSNIRERFIAETKGSSKSET